MSMPTANTDLQARSRVRLRLRPNLIFSMQESSPGQLGFVVKDPVSLRYFRFEAKHEFVMRLMDGRHSLADIQTAFERNFRPERLPLEELESFASQLISNGLVLNASAQAGRVLLEKARQGERRPVGQTLLQILSFRMPLFDPNRLLGALLPWSRWLFTWPCLILVFGGVLSALGLLVTHWSQFVGKLPSLQEFFNPRTVVYLWFALGAVKIVHELGHGLCCKKLGGDVPEMGVMLLMFFPALYCNVSDSWKLPSRWQRLAVSAAGIYLELIVAVLATCVWWFGDNGSLIHHLAFGLMVVCSVNTLLFNGNPLMRFDGYFILSDWLDIPNLAEQSTRHLQGGILRWLGLPVGFDTGMGTARQRFLVLYGLASYVYRWVVLLLGFYCLHAFLRPYKLGSVCLLLLAVVATVMIVQPLWQILRALTKNGRWSNMRMVRVFAIFGVLSVGIGVFCLVPFSRNVKAIVLIQAEPEAVFPVMMPQTGGFLCEVRVRDGQAVRFGQVLAVITNPKLEIDLRVNEADQELRRQQEAAQLAQLSELDFSENTLADQLLRTRSQLRLLRQRQRLFRQQRDQLIIRAPCSGMVMSLRSVEDQGRWLDKGQELCRIANPRHLRAILLVDPADQKLIAKGSKALIRIHGGLSQTWPGVVGEIAQVEAGKIPRQLSGQVAGDVNTQADPVSHEDRPRQQHYLVSISLSKQSRTFHPGVMGKAQIEVSSQTLLERARKYLAINFSLGL